MTWDSYVDLNETFTMSTPNGTSDSILVLDKTMRVVYSNAPSASSEEIIDAVESIRSGGSTSLGSYFFTPLRTGNILAFPRSSA